MVASSRIYLYIQLPWLHYVIIVGSVILVVTTFGIFMICFGSTDEDDMSSTMSSVDSEINGSSGICPLCSPCFGNVKTNEENVPLQPIPPSSGPRSGLQRKGGGRRRIGESYEAGREGYFNRGGNPIINGSGSVTGSTVPVIIQPPQQSVQQPLSHLSNQLSMIRIQPAHLDTAAHEAIRRGAVSLPTVIPDLLAENDKDLGQLYFSISYDVFKYVLKILIIGADRLPAKDMFGTSDPYVKVYMLPDKNPKFKTKVKHRNLKPKWNELFTFQDVIRDTLADKKLVMEVYDYDRFSKDDEIGLVELPLGDTALQVDPVEFSKDLMPYKNPKGWLGDLLISLCYKPISGSLLVIIMKCCKLKHMDITGKSDPYVKVYLKIAGRRTMKKKTTVKEKCLDPVWNEVMQFDVASSQTHNIELVFTIMDWNKRFPNKLIGRVKIGPRSMGTSIAHWSDMMNAPRKPVAMWHAIHK